MTKETPEKDTFEPLVRALVAGERRLHELPGDLAADEAARIRRLALEEITGADLTSLGTYSFSAATASTRHCENFVGAAHIPIGVAGPLPVKGRFAAGDFYIPLATTEGALVASVNRGCAALRRAGGVTALAENAGITRAPAFRTAGIAESHALVAWVRKNFDRLADVARKSDPFLRLIDVEPHIMGTTVYLRFIFDTGDAMGMNMATIACDRMVRDVISPETGAPCLALSGNFCVDKKPAMLNILRGRGRRISAEVTLSGEIVREVLKTTTAALLEVHARKILLGSIAAGALGFNAHFANVVAAFFLATGQDAAHVSEGALGITIVERREPDGAYVAVQMPDVPLAAIGGGTGLATQKAALRLLGVDPASSGRAPGESALALAEILGAAVLAGELSLLSALASSDLANAHLALARGVQTK
ncbi:MAG: hydroxymethylglutaryl-CoA reductase [Candidatus Schekmanbacteria bacterium]|nr:hydroxymethylglutaryl-CoA reductase [Candidatus Schekmanbacteria bacterium]